MQFTPEDYYEASLERLQQARDYYRRDTKFQLAANHHPLAYYHCGVAVECMLRAFITLRTKEFDGRHDLQILLDESRLLEQAPVPGLDDHTLDILKKELGGAVGFINRLWSNNLRYASEGRLRSYLRDRGFDRKIAGDPLKEILRQLLEATSRIIDRGVILWEYQK